MQSSLVSLQGSPRHDCEATKADARPTPTLSHRSEPISRDSRVGGRTAVSRATQAAKVRQLTAAQADISARHTARRHYVSYIATRSIQPPAAPYVSCVPYDPS